MSNKQPLTHSAELMLQQPIDVKMNLKIACDAYAFHTINSEFFFISVETENLWHFKVFRAMSSTDKCLPNIYHVVYLSTGCANSGKYEKNEIVDEWSRQIKTENKTRRRIELRTRPEQKTQKIIKIVNDFLIRKGSLLKHTLIVQAFFYRRLIYLRPTGDKFNWKKKKLWIFFEHFFCRFEKEVVALVGCFVLTLNKMEWFPGPISIVTRTVVRCSPDKMGKLFLFAFISFECTVTVSVGGSNFLSKAYLVFRCLLWAVSFQIRRKWMIDIHWNNEASCWAVGTIDN